MITFVVCVEPGPHRLEYKAATLFHTMRRNMGAMAGAAVWAYAPRPGRIVAPWCREMLEHFEVRLIEEPLNAAHADYALANKPLALAHAEETAATEFVTFLDTDILVWREPSAFQLGEGEDVALVADSTKTTASSGPGDPFEDYWMQLYELAGATARPFVTTTLSGERVRGSWNSGVIALRRNAHIAVQWRDAMLQMLDNDFSPPAASYLRENNLLSAVATSRFDRMRELSFAYNYPVQNWDRMTVKGIAPEEAVLWHYQQFLDKAYHRFAGRIDGASTLRERLALTERFAEDLRRNYRRRIGIDETWLQSVRRRARLGPRVRKLLGRSKPTDARYEG
ncbi:MAG TPA: hypothetical protein VGQ65_08295 [Thermoanaerobaculia bacterium]|jgi:hypothetical protein|nr:hypothetical protein [Thermoanaerobaculia bacterium]